MIRELLAVVSAVMAVLFVCAPGARAEWLYDAGQPHHAGLTMKPGSAVVWAAAPFAVASEGTAVGIGAAVGKAAGPTGSGFNVYLSPTLQDPVNLALASAVLTPTSTNVDYLYAPIQPVVLRPHQTYYLLFEANHPDFWGMISYTLTGTQALGSADLQTWGNLPYPLCIRIQAAPVPEPASIAGLLLGAACLPLMRRRRFPG